jgi:hypothetical protein
VITNRACVMAATPNTKVGKSKFKNGARFRRAKTKFLARRGRPFAILSLWKRSAGYDLPTRGESHPIIRSRRPR